MIKIAFGCITFESDFVLKEALASVYPYAEQILIAEGPVQYWQDQGKTTSTDETNAILESFPDPRGIIKVIHGHFAEKNSQCKTYMPYLRDDIDYIWNLDSDEIYKPEDIEKIIKILTDEKYTSVGIRSCSFYGGFNRYITGFEEACDNFLRIFKVCPGATWLTHRPPTIQYPSGYFITPKHLNSDELFFNYSVRFYHYSYVWPRQVHDKIEYYKAAVSKHKCIDNYYNRVYLPWVMGTHEERENIEIHFLGVHEWLPQYRGPTFTKPFTGEHPEIIKKAMPQLEEKFKEQLRIYGRKS